MKKQKLTARPTYKDAVNWIAINDNPGGDDSFEDVESYLTTCMVADLFGTSTARVAVDVLRAREVKPA